MFIDVTRHGGGGRTLRVAIAAIAYIDALPDGASLHLMGGQSLRIDETANDIEDRCQSHMTLVEGETLVASSPVSTEWLNDVAEQLLETITAKRPAAVAKRK